ncbi:MAG: hypothetical protein ACRCUK_10735 [Plesiomonas shigelloides]
MKQFKSGDAVKVVIKKDNLCYDRLNGLTGTYGGYLLFGHSVFVPELGCMIIADDVEPIGKTLLEILVDELPKRGGWPYWAAAAVQGCNGGAKVLFAGDKHCIRYCDAGWKPTFIGGTWGEGFDACSDFIASDLATDHATKIVTREEYESAAVVKASGDNKSNTKKTFHANNWMITVAGENATLAQKQLEDSIKKGRFTVDVGCKLGALPVPTSKKSVESKLERINRLRYELISAQRSYDNEFSFATAINDLKVGDRVAYRGTVKQKELWICEVTRVTTIDEADGKKRREVKIKGIDRGFEAVINPSDQCLIAKVS